MARTGSPAQFHENQLPSAGSPQLRIAYTAEKGCERMPVVLEQNHQGESKPEKGPPIMR